MPDKAPALCRLPPPEWQMHWDEEQDDNSGSCVTVTQKRCEEIQQWIMYASCLPAGSLLHTLVAVQDTFEQLRHQRLQVCIRRLTDNPVGISTQCPASDGPHQGFFIRQTLDQVGNELGQIRDHALHAACGHREDRWGFLWFAILKMC